MQHFKGEIWIKGLAPIYIFQQSKPWGCQGSSEEIRETDAKEIYNRILTEWETIKKMLRKKLETGWYSFDIKVEYNIYNKIVRFSLNNK